MPPAGRGRSGYREYSTDDVRLLRFVKRAQELGLSLKDVQELVKLRRVTAARRESVRKVAERRVADLTRRIADLTNMRDALTHLVHACHAGSDPHCPILEALERAPEADR
jgi:DNA-binding transcriptional MerR regulator